MADICVVAHVDDATCKLIAELPDGVWLPAAVLAQRACNTKLTGVVYDRCGKPIWRAHYSRKVTESQWQLLIVKWGGCFHCGANPGICQRHHIEPVSRSGPTRLDNLAPACWTCHQPQLTGSRMQRPLLRIGVAVTQCEPPLLGASAVGAGPSHRSGVTPARARFAFDAGVEAASRQR